MFTDLKGFDPDAFSANGAAAPAVSDKTLLDIDVAGVAHVSEGGILIDRAPEGVRFEPLAEHELLGTLVGADDKFSAHNLASWRHGLLVVVPKGVVLEQPLYVKVENTVEGGSLFWRLLVGLRGGRAGDRDRGVRVGLAGALVLLERRGRALRRPGREARVRLDPEPLARDVALRRAPRARRARRRARLGRRRLRLEEGQGADPERPRRPGRDLARHRRVLLRRRPAPRLRHLPGAHRAVHDLRLRLQGRAARRGDGGVARDDPRRARRAEDERLPGEPQPDALARGARRLDPGARDPRQRRALHARLDHRPGRPRAALLPDDARASPAPTPSA